MRVHARICTPGRVLGRIRAACSVTCAHRPIRFRTPVRTVSSTERSDPFLAARARRFRFPRLCTGITPDPSRWAAPVAPVSRARRRPSFAGSASRSPRRSLISALLAAIAPSRSAKQRRSVTPEVAGSSPVAPASDSGTKQANSRAFPVRPQIGSRHPEPPQVGSRQKNGDQTGDHRRAAWTGLRR